MKSLYLNHLIEDQKVSVIAKLILVFGVVSCASTFIYSKKLSAKAESLQRTLLQHQYAASNQDLSSKANVNKDDASEMETVKVAIKEIVLPWAALFNALESVNHVDVQLLALEPNAKKGTLKITAVTFNTENMMRYLGELDNQKVLKHVVLQSQESIEINGLKAIRFEIGALWII